MRTVHKYEIPLTTESVVRMPAYAKVIRAEINEGIMGTKLTRSINLWALVDLDEADETRPFYVYGTGAAIIDDDQEYVATIKDRAFIWHIFQGVPS